MGIDPRPPIRSGSGLGASVFLIAALGVGAAMVLFSALIFSVWAYRSSHTYAVTPHVVYAQSAPAVAMEAMPVEVATTSYPMGMPYGYPADPQFQARLDAGRRIQDLSQRDQAFLLLATRGNNADEAVAAVKEISDTTLRDMAAFSAAKGFSDANRPQESMTLVDMIIDQKLRDRGFRSIATGEWSVEAVPEEEAKEADATEADETSAPTESTPSLETSTTAAAH